MLLSVTGNPYNGYRTKIKIRQGETVALGAQFFYDLDLPLDISSYDLRMEINFTTPLLLDLTNGGITINNATIGQVQMNISSADSANLPLGCYSYDLYLASPNGTETPWLCGNFVVIPSITPVP